MTRETRPTSLNEEPTLPKRQLQKTWGEILCFLQQLHAGVGSSSCGHALHGFRGEVTVLLLEVVLSFFDKKSACCTRTSHTHVDSSASAFCSREILLHRIFHGGARFLTAGTQGTLMAAMNQSVTSAVTTENSGLPGLETREPVAESKDSGRQGDAVEELLHRIQSFDGRNEVEREWHL